MIAQLSGKISQQKDNVLMIQAGNIFYEVIVPLSVSGRISELIQVDGTIQLVIYHYYQIEMSRGFPVLIGFTNEIEKEFFQQFITVSGIGPRAAVKAINQPISRIAQAIDEGDVDVLKSLPGIGLQRARQIIAKLQGKIGKFGLIQDKSCKPSEPTQPAPDWQDEALNVLMQLQYKKQEAKVMIQKALERTKDIKTTEDLLNSIYKQRIH